MKRIRQCKRPVTCGAGLILLLLAACAPPRPAPAPKAIEPAAAAGIEAAETAADHLQKLFDEEWERGLRESPLSATFLGDLRFNDRWDDVSLETLAAHHRGDLDALTRLAAIDRRQLPPAAQLNYDLFKLQYENNIEAYGFGAHLRPVQQREGIQNANEVLELLRFEKAKDYQDWIARLQSFGTYMDQTIALLKEGQHQGRTFPKVIMQRVSEQIARQLVTDPKASPFYVPFATMPESIPAEQRESLRAAGEAGVRDSVLPAYHRFQDYFDKVYLLNSPDAVGLSAQPRGAEFYAFLAREHTTTSLSPEQIHEIGLGEVQRIRAQMEKIKEQVGFQGDLPKFFRFLRNDPQFFYSNPQDLLHGYMLIAKSIDPQLVRLFGKLPRTPYGVKPIPDTSAPDTTTAYYMPAGDDSGAGYFCVNLYKPGSRPKWEMEALTSHEAVPGHHLQISLQHELGEQPKFRKYGAGFTAYVEGWGLYSESLGGELGLYKDPYSKFGQLTYEMWRAVRLVVDTGLHAKGWTRQQAIDYFLNNAAKTPLDITNEIDRYLAMPGQALAYKIGELKIKELRMRAEQRLGDRFDIRSFHDAVLESGAVPLSILEEHMDAWIERQAAATPKP